MATEAEEEEKKTSKKKVLDDQCGKNGRNFGD